MSEEQEAKPSGIHEHFCEHPGCTEWGGLGYSRMKEAPRWFCREHKLEGERHIGKA